MPVIIQFSAQMPKNQIICDVAKSEPNPNQTQTKCSIQAYQNGPIVLTGVFADQITNNPGTEPRELPKQHPDPCC